MSLTLDVNLFLNKSMCNNSSSEYIPLEDDPEINIFDEIEHLLKFNQVGVS